MIRDTEKINTSVAEGLERNRNALALIEIEFSEKSGRIEEINSRCEDILAVITGGSFDKFRDELKTMKEEEGTLKARLEELQRQRDAVQLSMKQAVSAREWFLNMEPLTSFDEVTIRRLIDKIDVISKTKIKIYFNGGAEVEAEVEK